MIERVNPLDDAQWDARLARWPGASFFHSSSWNRVLQEAYGFSPTTFIERHSGDIRAILPMMEIRSSLTGNRAASLPFTDECEPLCENDASFSALFQAAVERGLARNWKYLEFRGGAQFFKTAHPALSFFGHRLKLDPDTTRLFAQFDSSVRRAIRKAEASDLTIEFTRSLDAVREFYHLLSRTRQRHGVPPQPFRFFAKIHQHVLAPEHGWVVLAKRGKIPVAGAIFFHFGKTALYKFGASNDVHQHLRGNNLVMWQAIQWYASRGFQLLDFGRTSLRNEGLRRFKLGWSSTEMQINYFKYDLCTRDFTLARDESSGWYNRVFNILPRSLSQLVGTLLYKHIA